MAVMVIELAELGAETEGERLRRARERRGLNVRDAAELISMFLPTSYATLARLERQLTETPRGRKAQLAFVALLVYGIDPATFGLADLQECKVFDREAILRVLSDVRRGKPACVTEARAA